MNWIVRRHTSTHGEPASRSTADPHPATLPRLQVSLFLFSVLLLTGATVLTFGGGYLVSRAIVVQQVEEGNSRALANYVEQIEQSIVDIRGRFASLAYEASIQQIPELLERVETSVDLVEARDEITSSLRFLLYSYDEFLSLMVIHNGLALIGNAVHRIPDSIRASIEARDFTSEVFAYLRDLAVEYSFRTAFSLPVMDHQFLVSDVGRDAALIGIVDTRGLYARAHPDLYVGPPEHDDDRDILLSTISVDGALTYNLPLDLGPTLRSLRRSLLVATAAAILVLVVVILVQRRMCLSIGRPFAEFAGIVDGTVSFDDANAFDAFSRKATNARTIRIGIGNLTALNVVAIVVIAALSVGMFRGAVMRRVLDEYERSVHETAAGLDWLMRSFERRASHAVLNESFQREMSTAVMRSTGAPQAGMPTLLRTDFFGEGVGYVRVYDVDGTPSFTSGTTSADAVITDAELANLDYRFQRIDVIDTPGGPLVRLRKRINYYPRSDDLLPMFSVLGYFELGIDPFYTRALQTRGAIEDASVMVRGTDDEVLFASPPGDLSLASRRPHTFESSALDGLWNVVLEVPRSSANLSFVPVAIANLIVALIAIIIVLVVSDRHRTSVDRSLMRLDEVLWTLSLGEHPTTTTIQGQESVQFSEFASLARAFRGMVLRLREMADQLRRDEVEAVDLRRRESLAMLTMLQTQINPHLLHNTMLSITALLRAGKVTDGIEMLRAAAQFFRATLGSGRAQTVSLEDELKHVETYIGIQRYRYEGRIQYDSCIDPDSLHVDVPRFLLQPLVENSIEHGMTRTRPLHIQVTCSVAGRALRIVVSDDGKGMSALDLEQLRQRLAMRNLDGHIGLANVSDRLRLFGGDAAMLTVESVLGEGTTTIIRVPYG